MACDAGDVYHAKHTQELGISQEQVYVARDTPAEVAARYRVRRRRS